MNGITDGVSGKLNEQLNTMVENFNEVTTGTSEADLMGDNQEEINARQHLDSLVDTDLLAQNQHHCEDVAEIKSFTIALLELAFEKQMDIASAAISALQNLGRKHPATVLRVLNSHLGKFLTFYSKIASLETKICKKYLKESHKNSI